MKHKRNWILAIVLSAAATFVALQTVNAPTQKSDSIPVTETATLAYEGCAYTWAYQDEPALTKKIDDAVKEINVDANAIATLFGEDCMYADGTSTFGVRETDITVKLPVEDLSTHEEFGVWIKNVMQIVTEILRSEIKSSNGFVEFWFEKDELENIVVRVLIQDYLNYGTQKTGIELFNMYYIP